MSAALPPINQGFVISVVSQAGASQDEPGNYPHFLICLTMWEKKGQMSRFVSDHREY